MALEEGDWERILERLVGPGRETFMEMLETGAAFAPVISAYRGRQMVCMAIPGDGDGERIASTARVMAAGFDADAISVTADSYRATQPTNPVTGRRWEHGEMEALATEHNGIAEGWVQEALVISVMRSDGKMVIRNLPYVRIGKSITWVPDDEFDQGTTDIRWREMERVGRFSKIMNSPGARKWSDLLVQSLRLTLGRVPSRDEIDHLVAEMLADQTLVGCTEVMLLQPVDMSEN